jgi:hypothetical protein
MRIALTILLLAAAPLAEAKDCDQWSAAMEEGEGGNLMVARICNAAGGSMTVQCGDKGHFMIAFAPTGHDFPPPQGDPDFSGRFTIRVGGEAFDRNMTYWAMDGVMGADVAFKDPLALALGRTEAITFAAPKAGIGESTFTLKGAAAALKKLKAACPRA